MRCRTGGAQFLAKISLGLKMRLLASSKLTNSSYESALSEGLFHACLAFGHSADLSLQKNFDNPRVFFTLLIAAGKNADTVCARFHWTFFLDLAMALV
jgi:hypothetical protein